MSLRAIIGGVEYPNQTSKLTECRTYGAFFDSEFTIGAAVSRQIDLTILSPGEIPRGAEIKLYEGDEPQGVFYIGTRPTDNTDVLSIHGYDAMLKADTSWLTDGYDNVVFPVSEDDALNDICSRMGIDRATGMTLNNEYPIDYPVGEYGDLTMREVLRGIAGANAGCFFINLRGELDLWRPMETRNSYDIGRVMTGFESAPASKPITMVYIDAGGGGAYRSGSYDGKSVNFYCPWGSHEMAESVRVALDGYVYQAFTSTDAICDIRADIGDTITANGVTSVIISRDVNYYGLNLMQLSAPETDELEDEYPYVSPSQRIEQRELATANARITRVAGEIQLEVTGIRSDLDASTDDLQGQLEETNGRVEQLEQAASLSVTQDQVNISIQEAIGEINSITTETGYRFDKDGLFITQSESDTTTVIDSTGLLVTDKSGNPVLTAKGDNVDAKNLNATTYLSVGGRARFENHGSDRVGCFWIGG